MVCLFDDEHSPRTVVRLDENNLPVVALLGAEAQPQAVLRAIDSSAAGLALFDTQNQVRVWLDLDAAGNPRMRFFDRHGEAVEQPTSPP